MTEYKVIPVELGADLLYKENRKQNRYGFSKAKKKNEATLNPFDTMFASVGELKYETDEDGQQHISFNA